MNKINNTIGKIEYGETRQYVDYGVNTSGTLATITFEALADGFCELGLYDVILSTPPDPDPESIPTNVTNGSVRIGLCGDVDDNNAVNYFDYVTLEASVLGAPGWTIKSSSWAADVDGNGAVNYFDYVTLEASVLGAPGWELNCCCS